MGGERKKRRSACQLSPLDLSLPQPKSMPPVQVQKEEVEPAATCGASTVNFQVFRNCFVTRSCQHPRCRPVE